MDLASIAAAVESVANACTGVDPTSIAWVNTIGAAEWSTYPSLELVSKGPRRARAWDWVEKEYDPQSDSLIKTQSGPREMVVTFRAETVDQTPGSDASQIISNLITRLQRSSVRSTLDDAGLALATIGDMIGGDYPADDRMHSVFQVDVLFNLVENDVDDTADGDWFNIVKLSSNKLTNVDGTDAGTQITDEIGPP